MFLFSNRHCFTITYSFFFKLELERENESAKTKLASLDKTSKEELAALEQEEEELKQISNLQEVTETKELESKHKKEKSDLTMKWSVLKDAAKAKAEKARADIRVTQAKNKRVAETAHARMAESLENEIITLKRKKVNLVLQCSLAGTSHLILLLSLMTYHRPLPMPLKNPVEKE